MDADHLAYEGVVGSVITMCITALIIFRLK